MAGSKALGGIAGVALALGALSLAVRALRRRKASSTAEPTPGSKKRPHSEAAAPEQLKRPRQEGAAGEHAAANGTAPQAAGDIGKRGSVTDTSALLAAKIAVPDADQSDPERLGRHYAAMAAKFEENGLNLSAVRDAGKYYRLSEAEAAPLAYADFPTPLARGAVRLGVFRLAESAAAAAAPDSLAAAAAAAAQRVLAELPEGTQVHTNAPAHYHTTVQMISHPSDPRPDAFQPGGGFDRAAPPVPIPAPSGAGLRREQRVYAAAAAAAAAPELLVHSVAMADSGALLLLLTEAGGRVRALRQRLARELPGAAAKQPSILHVTLARLLSEQQLSRERRAAIAAACEEASAALRGRRFRPDSLWHVQENTFTLVNVDETSVRCRFGGDGANK